ncbi:DMT family transporter [Alicyclobacillus sp. SO9]|uniref:DMT family transporter n=1 Tax=Alicyclobacillus sp. SO9 TaxID=2665646 RepID=UPI0018E72641|nr:DMT family transporter [Alicyclobacillus sp. SO9]QQE80178.1 DMT family transporter [Alicyclobacillus sp. SO9]
MYRSFVLVGVVAVSFSAILIKMSTAPAPIIGMYRLLFTSVLLIPVTLKNAHEITGLSRRQLGLILTSGVFLGLHFLLWIESLKLTSVASSMIVLSIQPVLVSLGAYLFFTERTNTVAVIAMTTAVLGSIVIAVGDSSSAGGSLFGDVLSLGGTAAISGYMLTGQQLRKTISSSVYSFLVFVTAAVVLFLFNVVTRQPLIGYSSHEWMLFVLLAVIPTLFGHTLFNWLLKYVSATTVAMSILEEPIGAITLAAIVLHEQIHLFQILGGTVTLTGVGLFLLQTRSKRAKENPATD